MYNTLKLKAKHLHYTTTFDRYKFDIRNTWKTINNITGRANDKTSIPQAFKINDKTITHPGIIANKFCEYFSNIGPEYANNIPAAVHNHDHYLTNNNKKKKYFLYDPYRPSRDY